MYDTILCTYIPTAISLETPEALRAPSGGLVAANLCTLQYVDYLQYVGLSSCSYGMTVLRVCGLWYT